MTALPDTLTKTHLDSDSDSPLEARGELLAAIDAVNTLRSYLVGLLGADGEIGTALTTLGIAAASTTTKGIVELATNAETAAGTDTTRAVTPAALAPLLGSTGDATESARGVVELATAAETATGTDATRAVTPAGLSARTATESRTGLVELATSAEVQGGSDTTRAVTPAGLATLQALHSRKGLVELATEAETLGIDGRGGADDGRAVTPAGLRAVILAHIEQFHTPSGN